MPKHNHNHKKTKKRTRHRIAPRLKPMHNVIIETPKKYAPPLKMNNILFPSIEPYKKLHLEVDTVSIKSTPTPCKIYVELIGNPKGIPVIYLHGGPGDYITKFLRRLFNPRRFHIAIFDQRGTGKSTPSQCIQKNTTQHSIQDIEKIRKELLNTEQVIIAGGSWGASLAILYAQAHPSHVNGILLRGLTDLNKQHHGPTNYFNQSYRDLFPEVMEDFAYRLKMNPTVPGKNIAKTLYKMVTSSNPKTREKGASIWANTAGNVMYLNPENNARGHKDSKKEGLTLAIIDLHYVTNDYFISHNQMIRPDQLRKIEHIPTYMVHGRYDVVCPLYMSYNMHRNLKHPMNRLHIVKAAHTYYEPEVARGCIKGLEYLGNIIQNKKTSTRKNKTRKTKTRKNKTRKTRKS